MADQPPGQKEQQEPEPARAQRPAVFGKRYGPEGHEQVVGEHHRLPLGCVGPEAIARQHERLAEERVVEVAKVGASPAVAIGGRLAAAVDDRTAAVLASSVLFGNSNIVPGLDSVLDASRQAGTELLVDACHHLDVAPLSLVRHGLSEAFVVGGGYKYCQLSEGNRFLRMPPGRGHLRPVLTGWFSEFASLSDRASGKVSYGEGPLRWAGAT